MNKERSDCKGIIPPSYITDNLPLVALLLPARSSQVYIGINDDGEDETIDYSTGIDATQSPFAGRNTLMEVDDTLFDALRPSQNRAKFVGIGNFSGLGFKNTNSTRNIKIRNICLRHMRESDTVAPTRDIARGVFIVKPKVVTAGSTYGDDVTKALMKEWGEECERQRKRSEKFGQEYTTPSLESFMKWSEAKRLRSNPQQGFITGIDTESTEEEEKRKRRQERFEGDAKRERARKRGRDPDDGMEDEEEEAKEEDHNTVGKAEQGRRALNPQQAYTNEKWLGKYRVDPKIDGGDAENEMDDDKKETKVPEKIHLFCIDVAAFKQIRTHDILHHFTDYGPSYVEWLGETSVNVMFEDKFSAGRALRALGQDIPKKETKANDATEDATMEEEGETKIESEPKAEEGGEIEEGGEGVGGDDVAEKMKEEEVTDLAALGWKFCKSAIFKVKDDRFGRRGTRSRFLLRTATSQDTLEALEDVVKLKMPKGFSTDKVISGRSMREERETRRRVTRVRALGRSQVGMRM